MKLNHRCFTVAVALAATAAAGCDNFFEVENPGVIEAGTVDPVADAETFSLSAQTNFFDGYDDVIVYGAFFSGEAWVDDTFTGRKDVARRNINERDNTLVTDLYRPLSVAVTSNLQVLELLQGTESEISLSTARAALNLGFALQLMAETFCIGVINVGPPLTPQETSQQAINYFQRAIELGTAVDATNIVNAARVGLARAYLHTAAYQQAAEAAAQVPADFTYNAVKVDDPSSRIRLGNTPYYFTVLRPNLVVPPYYRALNDPRVPSQLQVDPRTGAAVTGQGGALDFHTQTKYASFGSNIRLASGLEARYIHAEAQFKLGNPAPAQALVAERTVPTANDGNDIDFVANNTLLTELLDQKSRDFYLEGKHMGDWQRNPQATPYILPAGTPYYDVVAGGTIGTETCFKLPAVERENNPNFPQS